MIDRLTGRLERVEGSEAIVVPAGGFLALSVLVPGYLADRLQTQIGRDVTLWTHLILESQNQGASFSPRLMGFGSATERAFFTLFTTVKGVGPRKALRAMAIEPGEIARAIAAHDAKALTQLPEIGKRMAETIVAELDGKVARFVSTDDLDQALNEASQRAAGGSLPNEARKAQAALMALGETPADAESMVRRALALEPAPETSDELIRAAYQVGRP
ncbi:MAG: hypothetical protein KDA31_01620 [Phycisphaerales bacterium]|nr:hypothetical protein [Phycisphaerales bacterium]MCB9835196.1 hypothetical protein [Phycisphaera sp.]